jgi:RHS repeat-associated protein
MLVAGVFASSASATAPSNVGLPAVSGSFAVGQALAASEGDWTGSQPLSLAYQWQRCTPYKDVVLGDSPAAYWRLGEAVGASSAADSASSPDAGTYTNIPTLGQWGPLSGDPDRAVRLDGWGAFVDVPDAAKLKPASAFSLEAWVKTTAANGVVVDKPYAAGSTVSYSLSVAAGKAKLAVNLSGGAYSISSTASINDGQWHQLVGTFASSTLKLYLDGASAATDVSTSGSLQYSSLHLQIGRFDASGGNYLSGWADEIALYPAALSAAQVSAHYAAGTTANGVDGNCANISGATSSLYTPVSADLGKRLRVKVTASNGDGSVSASSYATVITPAAPASLDAPDLSGSAQQDQTLTAGSGTWSGATPITYAYQWQRCIAYPAAVGADVPFGYWRLGEPSGIVAADTVGDNGGTYVGSPSPTLGLAGALLQDGSSAVGFDGSTQQLTLGQSVQFDSGNFTLEAWFKSTAGSGTKTIWQSGDGGSGGNYAELSLLDGKLRGRAKSGSNLLTVTSTSTYTDGGWHQGVFVRSGTNFTLYVDGAQVATGTSSSIADVDASGAPALIANSNSGSYRYAGVLDEVAIYKSALALARIQAHYNARSAPCQNVGSNSASYTLGSADVGASVQVQVTATNTPGSATASSTALAVAAKRVPASIGPPAITGSPVVGQTVTADPGSWDQTGSYTYQWRRCLPYASVVGQDSPVDEWRLGERDPSKPTAVDSVGTRTGSYQGGPMLGMAGALSQDTDSAIFLDATSQQSVSIAQGPQFGSGPFTVEAWFRSTQASGQYEIWYSGHTGSVQLYLIDGKVEAKATDGTSGITLTTSAATYADGAWHYVAFTRSGTNFTLYVDGAVPLTGTKGMNSVDNSGAVADVGVKDGGNFYFTGEIDEVALYTSALSQTRIGAHRAAGLDPCTNLSGQTFSTYTVASADAGSYLSVKVGATNSAGTGYADSPFILAVPVGSPVNTSLPKITGTVALGLQLSASTGSWTGSGTLSYTYQWQRCDGYPATVTPDSPLRWYRLNDLSGTTVVNEVDPNTPHTTDGSYVGSPNLGGAGAQSFEPATSVDFNTSTEQNPPDQYATLPGVQLDAGDFTVEAWFKTSQAGTQQIWMSGTGNNTTQKVSLTVHDGRLEGKADDGGDNIVVTSANTTYGDNVWHHAAFVRSGSSFTLYLDGLQAATGTQSNMGDVDKSDSIVYVGRGTSSGTNLFKGSLDEVAVYTHALTAARILAHAKNDYLNCADISGATSSTYTPVSADVGKRLDVVVTASNGTPISARSAQTDSIYQPALSLDTPMDKGQARTINPTLKVKTLGTSGYDYELELAESDKFEKVLASSGWQPDTPLWTVQPTQPLEDGKSYYWRGRGRYPDGTTTRWSDARSLTIKVKRLGLRDSWPIWNTGPLSVNEATGNLNLSVPNPSYPSVAGPLALAVTYNSLDTLDNGLGAGWTIAPGGGGAPVKLVDHNLFTNDPTERYDSAEVVWPDGSSDFFSHVGDSQSNVYQAPPGSRLQLKRNKDKTWILNDNQGSVFTFAQARQDGTGDAKLASAEIAAAQAGKAKLTYTYNDTPLRLKEIKDPADRTLTLTWNSLNSTGCTNAIVCATGPDNVTWRYIGDGSGGVSGKLVKVNDGTRDLLQLTYTNGKPTAYQNANDLNPSQASPGYDGTHKVTIAYTNNLVTTVAEGPITGQAPSTSTWSFAYHPGLVQTSATAAAHGDLPAGSVRSADGYTEITPPRQQGTQNKMTVYYDDLDHTIETVDLLGHHTRSSYTYKEQLEWTEDQDGNPTDYTYDPGTDALLSKTEPDAGGRPVTRYRYDEQTIGTSTTPGLAMHGLRAAYYANPDLSGRPAAEQTDAQVDFSWGTSGPAALGYRNDNYAIRWTGTITVPEEADYTFTTVSDGDTRLVVGDSQAVDDPNQHWPSAVSSQPIHLKPGAHPLTLEYVEHDGAAEIHLRYSCPTCTTPLADQIIPTSVLAPNWQLQTSTVSPLGRVSFSHYANPASGQPDYTEQLVGGTSVFTSTSYDDYGRLTMKVSPRGNAALSVGPDGNLNGVADTTYATTWTYYALSDSAAPPAFCGGSGANQAGLLKQTTPPATTATTTVYDAAGRAIANTDTTGTTCTTYSSEGRKTQSRDANGHTTTYTYDPTGSVRTVTAADNSVTTTAYDESGAVKTKTDANNHTTTYAHDAEGNTTSVTDPLGHATTTAYDTLGRKTSTTDPLNHTTSYGYDNEGRLTTTTTPRSMTTTTAYDKLGRRTSVTDPLNHSTSYGYDADGEQTSVTDPLNHTTSSTYDALGRLVSKTDANNHTTSYAYDLNGNQVTITAPDNGITAIGYDAAGRKTSVTDPLSHTTFSSYDATGRLVSTTLPTGETTQIGYDPVGNKISETDAAGKTTTYSYDAVNRLISQRSPLGEISQIGYDPAGNKTSTTDPLNHTTTYAYDSANRLTLTTDALNHATTQTYDDADRLISTTDANNHTTSYGYDADGNRTSVTGPDGSNTTLTYDDAGNLLTRSDDNNHTTSYAYDAASRMTSKTDPLNRIWTYTYDPVGNKTKVVDANGDATSDPTDGTTTYTYDANDRLSSIDYSDSTPDVSFTYDLAGRKTAMSDGAGTQSYAYDNSDRLTGVTRGATGFSYSYDSAGRLASRTYPDGTTTSYGYDDDSRLSTVTAGMNTTGYTYDAAGRLTATAYPNGWTEQRSYDNADRLNDIRSVNGQNTLALATYTRDNVGNPTQIVRDGVTETYAYDNADRITAACYGGQIATCASGSKITYAYDKVGNRTSQTKFGTTTSHSYDAADELSSTTSGGNTTNYSYDNDGQQTGQGTKTFAYNLAGQLTQAADASTTLASFTYDGNGNRLSKTANAVTTSYAWDENNDLPQLALEQEGGSTLRSYQYGSDLISMSAGGSAYYFHHDALGTTSAITKQTGATEWTYTYDPYGDTRTTTKVDPNAPDNPIQYTGQLLDSETGLYDLRARSYDPGDGRFLSTDPLSQDAGDPALSLYIYADGQPLLLADPSGQRPIEGVDLQTGEFTAPAKPHWPCPGGTGWWTESENECPSVPGSGEDGGSGGKGNSAKKPNSPSAAHSPHNNEPGAGVPATDEDKRRMAFALAEANKIRTPEDFAIVLLTYMGLPVNKTNIEALLQWESTEGGHWKWQQAGCQSLGPNCSGWHNPVNTGYLHEKGDGGPLTPGDRRPNGSVAEYPTWKLGIEATAHTLLEAKFAPELNVLKRSEGGAALKAAVASTPAYGTIASQWTTRPIGIYAYSNYRKSPFLYKG